ncbi:MAG: ATP-binding cassette domain-containing protein [Candidatus Dormibacteraeota bacterium]|uniref:ATP-binding cassette domain-containing protein n=1 Tax=Candidatus Aeolococcus gillhamiae TaxID=3127015 RepID=A0A2W5ZD08_9BACT|nr:ATP-binding cassette domain-containing protein [Candidatus Dormibacteraeota bacterium]PZR83312.1 MAG: daunorubicin/doxorubicin resistance ABC transporter ATP-binding protein DrrA [Candidatus Dormibacter sp. RRmetagenome_bin12]
MTATIQAEGVVKTFGKTRALDGLDLTMEPGQVLAVLGPNGAGKTTLISIVATLLRPDAGVVCVGGHDVAREPASVRRLLALAGQNAAVEPAMTGRENVEMVARLFGVPRAQARADAARVLEQLGLTDAADRTVRTYSGGMRRRLDLGASLVGRPRLLLLDEPTTGLDPRSRLELWDLIRALVANGTDVLLSTQYLDEADHLASHVAIIDHGRVVASGTPRDLKQRAGRSIVEVHVRDTSDLERVATTLAAIGDDAPVVDVATRSVRVRLGAGTAQLFAALRPLDAVGISLDEVSVRQPTLDEAFLALTTTSGEVAA